MNDFATDLAYLPFFFVGLSGGAHCVGMCGGIVSALSLGARPRLSLHLAYNAGRILSYMLAGALVGYLGSRVENSLSGQFPLRMVLFVFANLMLLAMGLYLLGMTQFLGVIERQGQRLWRTIQPLSRRFLPAQKIRQAFPLGLLWGWLPCGLVYSSLSTALASGTWQSGMLIMLVFGLGTLPNLLLAGFLFARLRQFTAHPWVRRGAGGLVFAYGAYGLWHSLPWLFRH